MHTEDLPSVSRDVLRGLADELDAAIRLHHANTYYARRAHVGRLSNLLLDAAQFEVVNAYLDGHTPPAVFVSHLRTWADNFEEASAQLAAGECDAADPLSDEELAKNRLPIHQTWEDFYKAVREAHPDVDSADPYVLIAAAAFHCDPEYITDGDRERAKRRWFGRPINFADIWKMGAAALDEPAEPNFQKMPPRGDKHDAGKPRWSLFPVLAMDRIVAVLEFGAAKYGDNNWRYVEGARDRYTDAAYRHIAAWRRGETRDPDSGLPHLAHAICSLVFLLTVDEQESPTQ